MGMLGLALDSDLTPELRSYLGTARSSAESLLVILNDILDFVRACSAAAAPGRGSWLP